MSTDKLSKFLKFFNSILIFSQICESNQFWSAEEHIEDLVIVNKNDDETYNNYDEDEFVIADIIEEIEDELYSWALEIEQVQQHKNSKPGRPSLV